MQLLRDIGEGRVPDFKGKRVCVIGGGNVSMDATRTAIRLGASAVTCVYRRRVTDMTALAEEIEEAQSEGCQILSLQAPDHIETDETAALPLCGRVRRSSVPTARTVVRVPTMPISRCSAHRAMSLS